MPYLHDSCEVVLDFRTWLKNGIGSKGQTPAPTLSQHASERAHVQYEERKVGVTPATPAGRWIHVILSRNYCIIRSLPALVDLWTQGTEGRNASVVTLRIKAFE